MGAESVAELLERLKEVFRHYGYAPVDLSVRDAVRSKYRMELGREPHEETVAWFGFVMELQEPKDGDRPASRTHIRSPGGLIAPMMQPYTLDEAIEEMAIGYSHFSEAGPSQEEAPAFALRPDGTADFVLLGGDTTGFNYCLSPSSAELGSPRIFFVGEGDASFFLQVPGAFDDSLSLRLHEDMPTFRMYLEALVRAYHRRQLTIDDEAWIMGPAYYPWPTMAQPD